MPEAPDAAAEPSAAEPLARASLAVDAQPVGETSAEEPPLRVGLIADVQHADLPDSRSGYGRARRYRDALGKARLAAADWADSGCTLAVNLGDTVDRRAGADAPAALRRVLDAFGAFGPLLHVLGNHDLSALPGEDLEKLALVPAGAPESVVGPGGRCCDVAAGPGWRLLLLDTYDVSVRRCPDAARALRRRLLCEARERGLPCAHLAEHEELNGAVGAAQLGWLQGRLEAARARGERAVVLAHAALRPEPTYYGDAVCWNWQEVSGLLDGFSGVVAAAITGHDHHGGLVDTEAGVRHCVLEAALEGPAGGPAHAVLELHSGSVRLVGSGSVRSWKWPS
ncbi:unnamed protein product [Prorocentrum cordatum]|uniref:Calcineurin-like phosphoesterase domain-containing protein n=1 Tax=Prorocentrum cordatum TaxID=2364126 RepID=A0ABN9QUE7_9DINO|nr:unnamed protein product [Polarella glacialis]